MNFSRREFLGRSVSVAAGGAVLQTAVSHLIAQPNGPLTSSEKVVDFKAADGRELQDVLHRHAKSGNVLRLASGSSITCTVLEETVGDEKSIHPLLIPEGVVLDLNGSTLLLDLRNNAYGVRLSNSSGIRNGTIRIVRSENKGSQSCWHAGVTVGAAYGDGGTPDKPGYFSTVSKWSIENMTIDQPFAASAIQLMSEACHGVIRNIRVLDSAQALLGVGLDWGGVGPMTSEDKEIPRMRKLWEQGLIYSTHPHDILIENVRVGKLTRNVDGNDAGVRCSACHRITIRDIAIEEAATAIAIFGGDCGYEYARQDQRDSQHAGYVIEDVRIAKAYRVGLVLNGASDNIWRATRNHKYDAIRDPVHPGLDRPIIRNVVLKGPGKSSQAQGIYAVSITDAQIQDLTVAEFGIGIHVEDWVRGMRFQRTKLIENEQPTRIEGVTEAATGVQFDPA